MAAKRPFRVVIAGGGVAGLTLANALEVMFYCYLRHPAWEFVAGFISALGLT